jgi:hypothetical protein
MTVFKCKVIRLDGHLYVQLPDNRDLDTPNEPFEEMLLKGTMKSYMGGNSFVINYTEFNCPSDGQIDYEKAVEPKKIGESFTRNEITDD